MHIVIFITATHWHSINKVVILKTITLNWFCTPGLSLKRDRGFSLLEFYSLASQLTTLLAHYGQFATIASGSGSIKLIVPLGRFKLAMSSPSK